MFKNSISSFFSKENIYPIIRKLIRRIKPSIDKTTYVIYTMSKVGTTSLSKSIQKALPNSHVFHIHFLSDFYLKGRNDKHASLSEKIRRDYFDYTASNPNNNIKFITLTRDPIARNLSGIIQNIEFFLGKKENHNVENLLQFSKNMSHSYALDWFETELNNYLDTDIYNFPFDKRKGYNIQKTQKGELLTLKLEQLNDCAEKALMQFIGIPIQLSIENQTSRKNTGNLQRLFYEKYRASEKTIEMVYNSKFVNHFYTKEEINTFKAKWTRRIQP